MTRAAVASPAERRIPRPHPVKAVTIIDKAIEWHDERPTVPTRRHAKALVELAKKDPI